MCKLRHYLQRNPCAEKYGTPVSLLELLQLQSEEMGISYLGQHHTMVSDGPRTCAYASNLGIGRGFPPEPVAVVIPVNTPDGFDGVFVPP